MNILSTIPNIDGANYVGINLTISIGQTGGHLVIKFGNEGGGYYPILIADEKSVFPIDRAELRKLTKWIDDTCAELDNIEKKWEKHDTIKD